MLRVALGLLVLSATLACGGARREILVYAAASLRDAVTEAASSFEGGSVVFNFAGSNTLAQQVLAGAPADLFLSADEKWMDEVERAGRVEPGTRVVLVENALVLVARSDSRLNLASPADLATASYRALALGDPRAVPAGRYAKAALGATWEAVRDRIVPAPDVRAALALVESDPEIVGIVYRTDAAASGKIRTLHLFETSPPIRYAAAIVAGAPDPDGARAFLAHLRSREARAVFERHGFVLPAEGE